MMSPEAIGRGLSFDYRETGFSQGVLDFANNSTDNALVMSTVKEEEFLMEIGIAQRADLYVRVPKESSSMLGIKVQLLGDPVKAEGAGHKLAFAMGMGSERDEFEDSFTIDLKSDASEFSLLHGYRTSPYVMFYDGITVSNYHFQGTVSGTNSLSSNDIDYKAANILTGHLGVIFGGHGFKLKVEWSAQKVKWTNTEEKLFQQFGMGLSAGW